MVSVPAPELGSEGSNPARDKDLCAPDPGVRRGFDCGALPESYCPASLKSAIINAACMAEVPKCQKWQRFQSCAVCPVWTRDRNRNFIGKA